MSERDFPIPVSDVVATVSEVCRRQGHSDLREVLSTASAQFEEMGYDNWNGGTTIWALRLEVPVALYASLEPRMKALEDGIEKKLGYLKKLCTNDVVSEVTITPLSPGTPQVGQRLVPSDAEVSHIWPEGQFRLFLSHVAKYKVHVAKLKSELAWRGLAAFVAHEDIEPSAQWHHEIELSLRSMHALAALVTPEFHGSLWTDQEVGWALGRGVLVVPVRLGCDPYGLVGKYQGVAGSLEKPGPLAHALAAVLLGNPQTHGEMRRSLVHAFTHSDSFAMSKDLWRMCAAVTDFSEEEVAAMLKACEENGQVARTFGVPEAVRRRFGGTPQRASATERAKIAF